MKSTLKKPAVTFCVLNVVFFVAWLVLFMFFGLGLCGNDFGTFFNEFAKNRFDAVVEAYKFNAGWTGEFCWTSYVLVALDVLFVLGLVIGVVLAIKRKRARLIWWVIMLCLTWVPFTEFVGNYYLGVAPYGLTLFFSEPFSTADAILSICLVGTASLTYLFGILTWFYGLAWAKRRLVALNAPAVCDEDVAVSEGVKEDVEEKFVGTVADSVSDDKVEEVVEETADKYEPMADFVAEPTEMVAQPEEIVVEEIPVADNTKEEATPALDKNELASLLRDVVRDIVRDEISRSKAEDEKDAKPKRPETPAQPSITGATFGGPLVVQYFNGGINGQSEVPAVAPAPAPVVAPAAPVAPVATPVKPVEPVADPIKEEKPAAPAVDETADKVVDGEVVAAPKAPIIRIPFQQRMLDAEKDMQEHYNELKNEFLSWGLHSRVSNGGDTFRLHRKTYCKLAIAGKSLKLYLALDPKDYADSKMPIGDASDKAIYAEIPLIFKVKSDLSMRRAKQLIQEVCEKDGLEQGEVGTVNWVKELKAEFKK